MPDGIPTAYNWRVLLTDAPHEREVNDNSMARKKKKLIEGMRTRGNSIEYSFYVDNIRYYVSGKSPEDCMEKAQKKREEIEAGTYKTREKLSVTDYMNQWLDVMESNVSPATIRTRRKLIKRMLRQSIDKAGHTFGSLKLCDLETGHVRKMQKSLIEDGLHTRTANETLSLLKQALQDAVNERTIDWNPAKAVKSLKQTEEQARDTIHRALTREEVDTFLKTANDSWYYPLYVFLLNTGMRIGEASALAVWDVTESRINVWKTVTREEVVGYVIREQTKTDAGRRTIPTRPEAWKAWNDQRRQNAAFNPETVKKNDSPVFTLPKGGIIRPDRVNCDIKRICNLAGIEYFTCHAFRATFTSRCIAEDMPVKLLMEILGHTDVQMTLGLYGHGEDNQKREQLLAVNL